MDTNTEIKLITEEELQQLLTEEQIKFLESRNFLDPELIISLRENILKIRTPDWTWKSLCGREWKVNLNTLECYLSCMN